MVLVKHRLVKERNLQLVIRPTYLTAVDEPHCLAMIPVPTTIGKVQRVCIIRARSDNQTGSL